MVILGEQLALDGLAPRKRKSPARVKEPAERLPVAHVVIDVQAIQLGQTFDYLVEERQSARALPGAQVRVRFAGRLVNGTIWGRSEKSETPASSLRYLERVLGDQIALPEQMRSDIEKIAEFYGGTRANIIRLALPPRVARVDKEPRPGRRDRRGRNGSADSSAAAAFNQENDRVESSYEAIDQVNRLWEAFTPGQVVWDALPGVTTWADDLVWLIGKSLTAGRPIVAELPDSAHIRLVDQRLKKAGLRPYSVRSGRGVWQGDYCVLAGMKTPEERYRSYMAIARGEVTCVIGARTSMYAPVTGPAVFVCVDDIAYQNADGFMPYPNARDVMLLRARNHKGIAVMLSHARSPQSQAEVEGLPSAIDCGPVVAVHGLDSVVKKLTPWVRVLNRAALEDLTDPTVGSRVPHTAVRILNNALESGPVLISIPYDGQSMTLICSSCHRQARCPRCSGPLKQPADSGQAARCLWCGQAATAWVCPHCKGERMRVIRVGALGTAQELLGLFPHTRIVTSTPHQPRGVVPMIEDRPQVVIATPGAEPEIVSTPVTRMERQEGQERREGQEGQGQSPHYRAVAIVDTWTSLYSSSMDARLDTLTAWMRSAALCLPHAQGGQVLLLGECDPAIAQSLMTWNPAFLAAQELGERQETAMPPAVTAAHVWGRREVVEEVLDGLDLDSLQPGDQPPVLGPIPLPPPATIIDRQLEGSNDRVRAVVRVPVGRTLRLAQQLHAAAAKHARSRVKGELRFQINPKSLS
ncbi:PriA [Parascardovia denticolens]|uniref:primosomal protein N' family DNA-binding protein n=1 Tax=Parascardovia denticolens TaxID=78258 RepID=UPI00248E80FA|nr:PriA [Parascardovia denticolens]